MTRKRGASPSTDLHSFPHVTIIVAVHNEEAAILGKLENALGLCYPEEKLEVIVASDGSTDRTVDIVNELARRHRNLSVLSQDGRVGKTAVQNAAVQRSKSEIVVFTDVDTRFDSRFLEHIIRPFVDRDVGCATGALVWVNPDESSIAAGGDFYWRYEHFMWRLESDLGLLAWGSGACLAVRRELFKPMDVQYGEDCIVPLDVVSSGYRVVFQPGAIAYEIRIADPEAEMRVRVRMTLRSFAGTLSRKHLINPLRFGRIAWSIMSHKVLRWLTPYFFVMVFVSNLFLAGQPLYRVGLGVQVVFYATAMLGYVLDKRHIGFPGISTVYAFCVMNVGVFLGVAKAVFGHRLLSYRSEG